MHVTIGEGLLAPIHVHFDELRASMWSYVSDAKVQEGQN